MKRNKTQLDWIKSAVSTKATKEFLSNEFYFKDYIIGCDGDRIHRIANNLGLAKDYDNPPNFEHFFNDRSSNSLYFSYNKETLKILESIAKTLKSLGDSRASVKLYNKDDYLHLEVKKSLGLKLDYKIGFISEKLGNNIEVGVNLVYLIDALNIDSLDMQVCKLSHDGELGQISLDILQSDNLTYEAVIMPLRLDYL